jgi:hypothetical protein
MVRNAAAFISSEQGEYVDETLEIPIGGRVVTVEPDRMVDTGSAVHVQIIRTGRQTKSEGEKPIYGLMRLGAQRRFPGHSIVVEAYYPSEGETRQFSPGKEDKAVKAYESAIAGIEAGLFGAKPSDPRFCPNCQCYFICGI